LKLSTKIILSFVAVIVGLIALTDAGLSYWLSRDTTARVVQDLGNARTIVGEYLKGRLERLSAVCASVAEEPRFKAAISESDQRTILDQAQAERDIVACDLVLVEGPQREQLAWVGPKNLPRPPAVHPQALPDRNASGIRLVSGRPFQLATRSIRFGTESEAGVLILGEELDAKQAQDIQQLARVGVVYVGLDGQVGPTTVALPLARALVTAWGAPLAARGALPTEITVSGERELVVAVDLSRFTGGTQVGHLLLVQDLDESLADLKKVQTALLLGGLFAFVASLGLSVLLVKTVTSPVQRLVTGVQEVGKGNYDFPIRAASADEIGLLAGAFEEMRVNLKGSIQRLKEAERVKRDLELARRIQASLLPNQPPQGAGFELAGRCIPAREVGGDYFDYLQLPDGRLALVIVDVSGHNIGAALMMAMSRSVIKTAIFALGSPKRVLLETHRVLYDDLVNVNLFITAFVAVYDPSSGLLTYASAGHNPPFLIRAGGAVEKLKPEGMLIGVIPDLDLAEGSTALAAGDMLVLYTDGVVEAADTAGELLGEARFIEVLQNAKTGTAPQIVEEVFAAVNAFSAGDEPDDITLLVLKIRAA
jgi:HAMP domain-containing protein